ncbi:MAG: MMPL family transporter, partial [Rhodothermales bacterium]
MSMWSRSAVWILDHPRPIWTVIVITTIGLGLATLQLKTEHAAGSFVSDEDEFVRDFRKTGRVFGRSETILYVVLHDTDPLDSDFLQSLDTLTQNIASRNGVESVLSLSNVPHLKRVGGELITAPVYDPTIDADELRARFAGQPFLQGLLLSEDGRATVMMVRIEHQFNDTPERVDLVDAVQAAAKSMPGEAALAGFPYLRTQYAKRVTRETPIFTLLALLISLVFLFVTFRAWRTIVLPTFIVGLGILWTFGLMALFGVKLNIVTAVLPALIVIIGMATAIHLSTKFFDQYALLRDRRKAVIETIRTVGLSTFLAAFTTAIGFAVLLISGNSLLIGFGGFAAIGIMLLYALSITVIPLTYVRFRPPRENVTALATHDRFTDYFDAKARFVQRHSDGILWFSGLLVALSIFGITRISTDIFVFSDFYEDDPLRLDLAVFEEKFSGVLPMEVVIESDRDGRFKTLGAMQRVARLQETLGQFEPVGTTLSAVDLMKMGNQAYFGNHPAAYRLPSTYELPFLQSALGRFIGSEREGELLGNLPLFVDSTFRMTRIYLGVDDIGTDRMNELADSVESLTRDVFSEDEYDVLVTGTAMMSTRSGES